MNLKLYHSLYPSVSHVWYPGVQKWHFHHDDEQALAKAAKIGPRNTLLSQCFRVFPAPAFKGFNSHSLPFQAYSCQTESQSDRRANFPQALQVVLIQTS